MVKIGLPGTGLAFAFSLVLAACGSGTAPQRSPLTTTYTLVTIDGKALPLPEASDSSNVIENGRVELIGNDSARIIQTVVEPGVEPIMAFQVGYYSVQRNGSTLVFHPDYLANPVDTASLLGNQLAMRAHIVTATGVRVESRIYMLQ